MKMLKGIISRKNCADRKRARIKRKTHIAGSV